MSVETANSCLDSSVIKQDPQQQELKKMLQLQQERTHEWLQTYESHDDHVFSID